MLKDLDLAKEVERRALSYGYHEIHCNMGSRDPILMPPSDIVDESFNDHS
jgi:hypothetical protein